MILYQVDVSSPTINLNSTSMFRTMEISMPHWKGCGRKRVWPDWRTIPTPFWRDQGKPRQILALIVTGLAKIQTAEPPQYKTEVLCLQPTSSVLQVWQWQGMYTKCDDNWPVDLKEEARCMIIPYPYPFNNILLLNVGW